MTALTADRSTRWRNPGNEQWFEVKASTTVYAGSLVCIDNTTGKAEPATNAAAKTFVGVSQANAVAAASGTTYVKCWTTGEFLMAKSSAAVTDVGDVMSVSDDQTLVVSRGTLTTALTGTNNDLVFTAKDPYQGYMSDLITITYLDPGHASHTAKVDVYGTGIVFTLGTDTSGTITTTAANIKTLLAANTVAAAMVSAADADSNDASGTVTAMDGARLSIGPIVGTAVGYDSTTQCWVDIAKKLPVGF